MATTTSVPTLYTDIHSSVVELLETTLRTAARSVNALMTAAYWEIFNPSTIDLQSIAQFSPYHGQQMNWAFCSPAPE